MTRRPPKSTRTDTLYPNTTLFRTGSRGRHGDGSAVQPRLLPALTPGRTRPLLALAGAASAAPAGSRRLALVDRVPPRPDQRDRDRGEQEHALQFQRPAALVIELADLAHFRQAEGEQHFDRDADGPDPRVEADPPPKRRNHLPEPRAAGHKPRQADRA